MGDKIRDIKAIQGKQPFKGGRVALLLSNTAQINEVITLIRGHKDEFRVIGEG